jgi:hypothetical protein
MTLKEVLIEAAWFALVVPPALAAVWLMANFLPLEVFALVIIAVSKVIEPIKNNRNA